MRILSRYICSQVIWSTIVVIFVLIGIESFMEFVGQLSDIGVGHYGIMQALLYVPLQLPTDLYELFPMAGFLGSVIGLGRLASTSQLIVMRAAGVSIFQIGRSVIKAALIMIVVMTIIGEWLAPHWQNQATHIKAVAMKKYQGQVRYDGIWLKKKNSYINIVSLTSPTTIAAITQFDFDSSNRLASISFARSGHKTEHGWQLHHIQQTLLNGNKIKTRVLAVKPLGVAFEPKLLKYNKKSVDQESVYTLFHNILYREKSGLIASRYQYALWKRIIQPITTIVMICLAIPFIFGSLRSASMGYRIMTGVIIGFGFYMLNQFFGPITLVYQFPPLLAAALPTVLFMVAYVILLKRIT